MKDRNEMLIGSVVFGSGPGSGPASYPLPEYAVCSSEPKPLPVSTFTRWAIRHKPSGNFIPASIRGKYTQSEPTPNCIPRLFDTKQGAMSALNRWLEGIWRLSYYRCGEYDSEWDYNWGPEQPPTPRVKSEMEVVEVEIQIRVIGERPVIRTPNQTKSEITKGSTELTPEEIRTIAIARVASSREVDDLLAIIDRLTGTRWEIDREFGQ